MGSTSSAMHKLRTASVPGSGKVSHNNPAGLTPEHDRAVRQAAADQASAKLRDKLIAAHMPMAARVARTFARRGEDIDDLTQAAMLALVQAVSRFDPGRGVPFAQYAYPCIVGGIKKHFRETGWSLHVTRRMQELHLQLSRAIPELAQTLRRAPTVADLAGHLRLSEQDIRDGLSSGLAYQTRSLNLPVNVGEDCELGNLLGGPDAQMEAVPDRHALREHVATLPKRQQQILRLRFDGGMTQQEIAKQLGISQMHVSRLLQRSFELLRTRILSED